MTTQQTNASWKKKSYLILEGFDKIIYVYTVKGKKKKKEKERKKGHSQTCRKFSAASGTDLIP